MMKPLISVPALFLVSSLGVLAAVAPAGAEAPTSTDPAALTAHARSLLHAGKLKQAEDELRTAAKLRGQDVDSLYELARVEFATGDLRRAKSACKALTTKDDKAVLSQVCQARAFLVWRRASRAEEYLDKARAIDPSHPEVLLAFADMKRLTGDLGASKDAYQQVLGLDPNNVEAYFGLGELALVLPDREAAKSAFRKALEHEPEWTQAQYELGRLVDGAEAVTLLEKAVAARPDWTEARLSLGIARLQTGDSVAAETLFRELLKTQPKNPAVHSRLGMVLAAKHDFAAAQAELTQGLAGLPNDAEAVLALGRVYAETDRSEEAFTQFRSAASLDRQNPTPLLEAGMFALKISRNALAQAFLEKALERAPKSAQAHASLADSLLARGDKAGAKTHYKLALEGDGAIDRKDVQHRLDALP